MRALVICPYLPDADDHGGKIRSRVFLRALAAHCSEVELAVPAAELEHGDPSGAESLGCRLHALPDPRQGRRALRKLGHWLRGRSELLGRRFGPEAAVAVAELRERVAVQLLVADSSFALPLLESCSDQPWLLHLHNVEAAILARPRPQSGRLERWQRAWESRCIAGAERRGAAQARLTITVSAADRDHLRALGVAERVEVVENSIDCSAPAQFEERGAANPRLLFVGSFDYPPNLEAVQELCEWHWPRLQQAIPQLRLRLVGHDPQGQVAALAARSAGIEATGRVEDLAPEYAAATAVYLPIRSGGGTRIKILEACARACPVLATGVAVEGLTLRPQEHYLPFEDPESGLAALQQLLAGEAPQLGAAARQLVEARYSHRHAGEQFARLFRQYL